MPGRFSVDDTARRVGHYKWVEMRLFELLGGWVGSVPEVDIKHRLGMHCYHHSFHAEQWHARLPELREMNPERLTRPANPEVEEFFDALAAPDQPDQTLEKLVGLYRVLLHSLIATYTTHLNGCSTVTDAPTMRTLELCLRDDMEEWRDGEMMVQSVIGGPEDIERAAAFQAKLAGLLLAADGVTGPNVEAPVG